MDRDAIRHNPVLFGLILLLAGWIVLGAVNVALSMDFTQPEVYEMIGHAGSSGLVGLLVMATAVGLLLVLFSELGDAGPAPDRFPPEERD